MLAQLQKTETSEQVLAKRGVRESAWEHGLRLPDKHNTMERGQRKFELRPPTLSIVIGDRRCNAACRFCSSKMEQAAPAGGMQQVNNQQALAMSIEHAQKLGVYNAQITGKGEPTLFPNEVSNCLTQLGSAGFSSVELQTNGILLARSPEYQRHLAYWRVLGLTTIAISVVHYEPEKNRKIYIPSERLYINLPEFINKLHKLNFVVRLSCTLLRGYIDSAGKVAKLLEFAAEHRVEELNLRPLRVPRGAEQSARTQWVMAHSLSR